MHSRIPAFFFTLTICIAAACVRADVVGDLHVEYGDCVEVLAGPRCVLNEDRTLRLWVQGQPGATLTLDDGRRPLVELARFDVDGGTHFDVQVPKRASRIRVRSTDRQTTREWSMALAREEPAPELAEVKRRFNSGDFDGAESLLLELINNRDFLHSGGAHRLAGIFYHNRGAPDKARRYYQLAIEHTLAEGRWMETIKAANALSYLLQHTFRDFAAAREVYAPLAILPNGPAEGRYFARYDGGLLGFNTGDRRAALQLFERAARQAERMGDGGRWLQRRLDAEELLAAQLQRLGRRDEASAYFDAWKARDLSTLHVCEQAYFKLNLGWNALLSLEAGDRADDPTALLEEALVVLREHCKAPDVASGEINLALAHFHAGRFDESAAALDRARSATQEPELRLRFWELDIGARLALASGEPDVALAMLDGMERLAGATLSPDATWRAAARRGLVLETLGRTDEALTAYAAADEQFVSDLQNVPVYAGRGQFSATREWVMRRRLSLLQPRGASDDIARWVRQAQRRTYDVLAARSSAPQASSASRDAALAEYQRLRLVLADELGSGWRVPADELAQLQARRAQREQRLRELLDQTASTSMSPDTLVQPPPGDLRLFFHPMVTGWITIAVTADRTTTYAPDCATSTLPARALAQCLLNAASDVISVSQRVLITPTGPLLDVDFHALEFGDDVLLRALPVLYSPDHPTGVDVAPSAGRALIVGDPTRQLPASRREATRVAARLVDSGRYSIETLMQQQASFTTVLDRLTAADVFHFAGHATYTSRNAWSSGLALAGNDGLSIRDVLSLTRVPPVVVLSACNTARSDAQSTAGTLGLAQAFVLRGATTVVATGRAVRDTDALAFSEAFYARWSVGEPAEEAFQSAQLALRDAETTVDWAAFRLLVP
ncbi:MAG: CHAT domain-containing protein [Gammaproteobacteria bacterium]